MEKHNFVTIADLTKEKILYMIEMAEQFEKHPNRELLKGKVVATLFFEPSTPPPTVLVPVLSDSLTQRSPVEPRERR